MDIIERLFTSLNHLDEAINKAKNHLKDKEIVPKELLDRINSYDEILLKQKSLANALSEHINNKNIDEINRHVLLINGLSEMIRDDARDILSSLMEL